MTNETPATPTRRGRGRRAAATAEAPATESATTPQELPEGARLDPAIAPTPAANGRTRAARGTARGRRATAVTEEPPAPEPEAAPEASAEATAATEAPARRGRGRGRRNGATATAQAEPEALAAAEPSLAPEPEPVPEEQEARLPSDRDQRNRRGGRRTDRDRAPPRNRETDLEAEIDRALLEQKGIPPRDPRTLPQGRQEPETDAYAEQPQREYIQRDYYASRNRDTRREGPRDRDSWRVTRSPLPQQQPRTDNTPRSPEALVARQNVLFEEFTQQQTQTLREIQRMVTNIGRAAGAGTGGSSLMALPKVGIFLDVPNLIYAAEQVGVRIHFGKLLDFLTEGRQLVRATAYAPITDDPSTRFENQRFVQPVINNGYKIVTKPWKRFADGGMKANFDIELAVDILTMSDRLDVVVLLSGDGDFRRVVELVESKGVRVEVVSFAASTAMELRSVADAYVDLGSILNIVGQ